MPSLGATTENKVFLQKKHHTCHASDLSAQFFKLHSQSHLSGGSPKGSPKKQRKNGRARAHQDLGRSPLSIFQNPSLFAVYAHVRKAVVDEQCQEAADLCSALVSSPQSEGKHGNDERKDGTPAIPEVVEAGLEAVFTLIKESSTSHPQLCCKALDSLLNILQGQKLEGLQNESVAILGDSLGPGKPACIASDGNYLYIHGSHGLLKVGTGYGGTVRGYVYASSSECFPAEPAWMGISKVNIGELYFGVRGNKEAALLQLDKENLNVKKSFLLPVSPSEMQTLFSDGQSIGLIKSSPSSDNIIVRLIDPESQGFWVGGELSLKLARKSLDAFGEAVSGDGEGQIQHAHLTGLEEEPSCIANGKDFTLVVTVSGKVLVSGCCQSLCMKRGPPPGSWLELHITKAPKIIQCSVGHEGQHALLVGEDGGVFFIGTARRGEDGEPGEVTGLQSIHVVQVALGSAHVVAISDKGDVYTFGMNHKGQCGLEKPSESVQRNEMVADAGDPLVEQRVDEGNGEWAEDGSLDTICPPGEHNWVHESCLICNVCKECTGECGCGAGDSGCAICGCCRSCAGEPEFDLPPPQEDEEEEVLDQEDPLEDFYYMGEPKTLEQLRRWNEREKELNKRQHKKDLNKRHLEKELNKSHHGFPFPRGHAAPLNDKDRDIGSSKIASHPPTKLSLPCVHPMLQVACGVHHTLLLCNGGEVFAFGSNSRGQLGVGDTINRCHPDPVRIPPDVKIVQIAAGSYHSVFLAQDGRVFSCGAFEVKSQISVIYQYKGQLGPKSDEDIQAGERLWFSIPTPVNKLGPVHGHQATWIGASGNQTFIKQDESLIHFQTLSQTSIVASRDLLGLLTTKDSGGSPFQCLMISRSDGVCESFQGPTQVDFSGCASYLDPIYDVLWRYNPCDGTVCCFNILQSGVKQQVPATTILTPEVALPVIPGTRVSRSQVTLFLLCCLDLLMILDDFTLVHPEEASAKPSVAQVLSREDYSVVNRFERHGGGWGYSGNSIEAIRFSCDTDILLGGFGLFGGRGEYMAKIKLFDLGLDGGAHEIDGEVLAETDMMPYECGQRQKHSILFDDPVLIQAHRWYVAWAKIDGPASDCGSNGQGVVVTDDQVTFQFKSSKKSNNGTDVEGGQIPQLLYRMHMPEACPRTPFYGHVKPVHILKRDFACTLNTETVNSLLLLLSWSWDTFKEAAAELSHLTSESLGYSASYHDVERLVYVCRACLRLLRAFIEEMFPLGGKRKSEEKAWEGESVLEARQVLESLLSDFLPNSHLHSFSESSCNGEGKHEELCSMIMEECEKTFLSCFPIFYPTGRMKWDLLSSLLYGDEEEHSFNRLLSATLSAMCQPQVNLGNILMFLKDRDGLCEKGSPWEESSPSSTSSPSSLTPLSSPTSALLTSDLFNYPLLVDTALRHHSEKSSLGEPECALLVTPSRFLRNLSSRIWNTGNGSPDAIAFSVDRSGILIAGAGIYGGVGTYDFELELLAEDDRAWYALRLRNHGGRTCSGDGGLSNVKGPDGTTFTFTSCSLSLNGTMHTRGQLPRLLYFSAKPEQPPKVDQNAQVELQGKQMAFRIATSTFRNACRLLDAVNKEENPRMPESMSLLSTSPFIKSLLPMVISHISSLPDTDAKLAVQIIGLVQELLPIVSQLNQRWPEQIQSSDISAPKDLTTSPYYAVVESEHPYKAASVSFFRLTFPASVKWMCIDFDSRSETAQSEDTLQVFLSRHDQDLDIICQAEIKSIPYHALSDNCPVSLRSHGKELNIVSQAENESIPSHFIPALPKCSGSSGWPAHAVVLPGNELIYSLETASNYVKEEGGAYGFSCVAVGHEWTPSGVVGDALQTLEKELAYLGSKAAGALLKPSLSLASAESGDDEAREGAQKLFELYHPLLKRGFSLTHPLTITQALEGIFPFSFQSTAGLFLRDFIGGCGGTSGGRLARWLQPESYVDPRLCQVLYSRDDICCGWPAIITVLSKDQYGNVVHAPGLKVEVKAMPIERDSESAAHKVRKISTHQEEHSFFLTSLCHALSTAYHVTIKDKLRYHAITVMEEFENWSFEELRYLAPPKKRPCENLLVRSNGDGTYSANWTPGSVGWYSVQVTVDGYSLDGNYKVEVKEPPQSPVLSSVISALPKPVHDQTSKLRRFLGKYSAGLRIRAHPSLQSEQIGLVQVEGTISFTCELQNDDGIWVRLSADSIQVHCKTSYPEAWCLQYNQQLGKTLLVPVEEPKTILDEIITKRISAKQERTEEGKWIKLDNASQKQYCFTSAGEAWTLVQDTSNHVFLKIEQDEHAEQEQKGFDFSVAAINPPMTGFAPRSPIHQPYVFGTSTDQRRVKPPLLPKPVIQPNAPQTFHIQDGHHGRTQTSKDARVEPNVSIKELVKLVGESRANGNGPTPPVTPPGTPAHNRTPKKGSRSSSPKVSVRKSSPVPIPGVKGDSDPKGSPESHSSKSHSPSAYASAAIQESTGETMHEVGSLESNTSALISSLTHDLSLSGSASSVQLRSESSIPGTSKKIELLNDSSRSTSQAETQTSPEIGMTQFSIGSGGKNDSDNLERLSPRLARRSMSPRLKPKRDQSLSPAKSPQIQSKKPSGGEKETIQEAMWPSMAESQRAVFAALLWHEGIVHDAMACASFLKFHPDLPKQVLAVPLKKETRQELSKEEKARFRHSVEVSSLGAYCHGPNANLGKRAQPITEEVHLDYELGEDLLPSKLPLVFSQLEVELPRSLRDFVTLWEDTVRQFRRIVEHQIILPSPLILCKENERLKERSMTGPKYEAQWKGVVCELCGVIPQSSLIHHMQDTHPGCGRDSGSRGYNRAGIYCGNMVGNCGIALRGVHPGYLLCGKCRIEYLELKKKKKMNTFATTAAFGTNPPHQIMRKNAMFLLELGSASSLTAPGLTPRSGFQKLFNESGFTKTDHEPFQCLKALGAQKEVYEFMKEKFLSESLIYGSQEWLYEKRKRADPGEQRDGREVIGGSPPGREQGWNRQESDGRVVITRKRNSSSEDRLQGDVSLLSAPSPQLQNLASSRDGLCRRPLMAFLIQSHNLEALAAVMKMSLRRGACRIYAFQALTWMLHTVTHPVCIHDILWNFVKASSLDSPANMEPSQARLQKDDENEGDGVLFHPMNGIDVAGEAVNSLPQAFYHFMQTISDLMLFLPPGSAVQRMAIRCWRLHFRPEDHLFLHRLVSLLSRSHVFSNINKILSGGDEKLSRNSRAGENVGCFLEKLEDLTSSCELKCSSRPSMIGSLTDGSTETFWESGEEDKDKIKHILITLSHPNYSIQMVYVHVDNGRDIGNKVSHIVIKSGVSTDNLQKVSQQELDTRFIGWVSASIPDPGHRIIRIELKSLDLTLRVRGIRILGRDGHPAFLPPSKASSYLRKQCEMEALKVFRLITSQVFGKLLSKEDEEEGGERGEEEGSEGEENDLREHMVGILFSQTKLTNLQKQVCSHIVQAIRQEAVKARENWENGLASGKGDATSASDNYCFEMLSMVLALSGNAVGQMFLAEQGSLIVDLLSLLHTSSGRVQRQVILLLRRVLPGVPPSSFASFLEIKNLPSSEFGILERGSGQPFDVHQHGILDVLLACISKALNLQVKSKSDGEVGRVHTFTMSQKDCIQSDSPCKDRWYMHGSCSRKLAQDIISLLQDMSTATCDNHEDGETLAVIVCNSCGNLCAECNRILHLPRRTHGHQRQIFREEEEAIRVDLHEGCGRTKLYWLLALADASSLKAMVDLWPGSLAQKPLAGSLNPGMCRFCSSPCFPGKGLLTGPPVCHSNECQVYAKEACQKILSCSHPCGGVKGEKECLPCLRGCRGHALKQDADDMCMICFTEQLQAAPTIQLKCGHLFHLHCAKNVLLKRWPGPRITFNFTLCPICKKEIDHYMLEELLGPVRALKKDVKRKGMMRLKYEATALSESIKDPAAYAMERYAYYVCFKCQRAYYGGEVRCELEGSVKDEYDPSELVCGACSDVSRAQMCPKHGTDFLEYKCRYCCSVAVFFCFGTTHFCNACHEDFQRVTAIQRSDLPHCPAGPKAIQLEGQECPLHVEHPATGEEFALGCGVCRNAHTF
ncbi:unnamed protein product [Darwinula stevensoni]|uniref:RCR-type E3 ubiquitin transferase n=1 Tax=Darwinula stevensoni TaxID=69355 RepID=A0A7R8X5W6_9CRUS|nr:unnamed protein product [Darwinula stevensoni]CAG0881435.1 unnamed protein product [Darwinula stevensoni]